MAKLTPSEWQQIRVAYEVDCASSTKLSKKHGVAESTICRRMKKEGWNRGKTQDAIEKKVSASKAFAEITQENASITQAANREVDRRLRLDKLFGDDAEHCQKGATNKLKKMEAKQEAELQHYDTHARITAKNKETLLGKTPQTQVNIQNNQVNSAQLSGKELEDELLKRGLPLSVLDE